MSIKARRKHDIIKAKGTAKYCHLNEPNKKFDPEFGVYSCDLVIDKEQAEQIKNTLRPLYEEELRQVQEANAGKKIEQRDFPIDEVDGAFVLKAKIKAGGRRRDDGSVYHMSVALYDSAGKPLDKDVKVWGGSEVNVAFRPRFWYTGSMGFGVTFDLQAVQVLKIAEGGVSSMAASAFGFTEEESGFVNGGENLEGGFDAEETEEEVIANF
tara:strand:- start:151 stop:783 length:633 start_codon:yes stop_codon:yes gene_type:complete